MILTHEGRIKATRRHHFIIKPEEWFINLMNAAELPLHKG